MNKCLQHFKLIIRHKYYVATECFKIGLYWQGLVHDLSKFSPREFFISAKYFTGNCSPIEKERIKKGYSLASVNHKAKNKHHYTYWLDINDNGCVPADMPDKYILEMACDFIGAGKVYNNITDDKGEPLKYYREKINKKLISKNTKTKFEKMLINYSNTGKIVIQ